MEVFEGALSRPEEKRALEGKLKDLSRPTQHQIRVSTARQFISFRHLLNRDVLRRIIQLRVSSMLLPRVTGLRS